MTQSYDMEWPRFPDCDLYWWHEDCPKRWFGLLQCCHYHPPGNLHCWHIRGTDGLYSTLVYVLRHRRLL